ncbi:PA14 domain-containing protein [Enhygromyxa salina]|uniref:PA14 domain protein n=1 Tax=Enhygromyxa salina TaxID=215803 RepID=A0A2S9XBX9_9BACT|nr:PA14 domain-containing protein [Enhygromyxa salina]PRP90362.1 PA14 domain protein [Enhygromyxa salina]
MITPDTERVLDAAATELRSAYTLVADPQCDPVTAMPHLQRAWQAVAWLSRGELPEGAGETLADWLAPEQLELIPAKSRGSVHAVIAAACQHAGEPPPWVNAGSPPPELPAAKLLLSHLRVLGQLVRALELRARGRTPKVQLAARWGVRAAWWVGGATAFVLLALRPWQTEDEGSWRGAYYPTPAFEGEPDLRREADVAFDWRKRGPTDSIPSDRFSARWDTCLVLEEDTEVGLQIVSDSRSRLWLNGEVVVDHWKQHQRAAKGARVSVPEGTHHLRVEYVEDVANASIHVTASFDEDETPAPIPADMLEFPGMEIDADADPCE